jgi:LmbE family N-acetylglucosaminyl deacetylase
MIAHSFNFASPRPTILLLGAHCDDIEIGCGATVMRLVARYPGARFVWVTFSADNEREAETRRAAGQLLKGAAETEIIVERFRGSYLSYCGAELKDRFEALKRFAPELVLTHYRADLHQDHRVVNELTWNTFRNQAVLEYEIPKFDGDVAAPNVFVPITRADMQRKCEILMSCFSSQRSRSWFTPDTFQAIARLRGIECNAPEGYAEAFYGRKACIAL